MHTHTEVNPKVYGPSCDLQMDWPKGVSIWPPTDHQLNGWIYTHIEYWPYHKTPFIHIYTHYMIIKGVNTLVKSLRQAWRRPILIFIHTHCQRGSSEGPAKPRTKANSSRKICLWTVEVLRQQPGSHSHRGLTVFNLQIWLSHSRRLFISIWGVNPALCDSWHT